MSIINGESIKNAVIDKLLECLPDVNIYKESTTNPEFPYCNVYQVGVQCIEERDNYFLLTYNMQIRYTHSYDVSMDLKLQQNLDNVALILMANFDLLKLDDGYIRCSEKTYEKVDGTLLFSFDIQLLVNVVDLDLSEIDKMHDLIYNIIVKE